MASPQSFPFGGELLFNDGSAILYPEFIESKEADAVLQELLASNSWEQQSLYMYGKFVDEPRLSTWHSDGQSYAYSGIPRTALPWTPTLRSLRSRCESHTSHTFNGVLVNYYRDGNDHLGWHSDDEMVNGSEPLIASVSLGAERRFELRHRESGTIASAMLSHGALLVMSGLSQRCWEHRVPKMPRLEDPRVNLTFRRLMPEHNAANS